MSRRVAAPIMSLSGGPQARLVLRAFLVTTLLCASTPASAELITLGEGDWRWSVGGYLRSASTLHATALPGDLVPSDQRLASQHVNLARLEHRLALGPSLGGEVHHRVAWVQGTSAAPVGLGVSSTPERSVDTRVQLVDRAPTFVDHDLDRVLLRWWLPFADITVGRQAITWGSSVAFPVSDHWAPLSPLELDTSQKRGVDALRVLTSPSDGVEVEAVVVDRGSWSQLAGGLRIALFLSGWDLSASLARSWERLHLGAGARTSMGAWTLRGEATLPWTLATLAPPNQHPSSGILAPSVTLGAERFSSRWLWIVETHLNPSGEAQPTRYLRRATDPARSRAESPWLGQAYAATWTTWIPREDLNLTLGGYVNLRDPSALVSTQARYDVAQNVDLALLWYSGIGRRPTLTPTSPNPIPITTPSEFGLYGHTAILHLSIFL